MKRRCFLIVFSTLISIVFLGLVLILAQRASLGAARGAALEPDALSINAISPNTAPNDLDTLVVITGTGFAPALTVTLAGTDLVEMGWLSGTVITAVLPWGLEPGIYTLTVQNPGGEIGSFANAFTVTQGIGVWNAGELYGGEFIQVTFHPTNPDILYAQASGAGLFRSRDHGESWSLIYNDAQMRLAVSPAAPDRIYVQAYGGLERSDDQGDTWVALQPPYYEENTGYTPLPHPTEPDTVYVGASSHLDVQRGVYKSTDAGQTWITLTTGLTDTRVTALAFHPTNPLTMYAGTVNGHIFISSDGGEHWAWASRPVESIRALVVEPWDDYSVWVDCSVGNLTDYCSIQRSLNVDLTQWETINPSSGPAFQGNINFSPVYTGTVYIGCGGGRGWRTLNDGQTWSELPVENIAPIWFAFDPSDPETIFAAVALQGIYKTTDGGETWEIKNQGLMAMKPVQIAIVPGHPDQIYAAFDVWVELFKGSQGGSVWQILPNAETAGLFLIDPNDPQRIYRSKHTEMCVSQDGGLTWPICSLLPRPDWCQNCISSPDDMRANPHQAGDLLAGMSFVNTESPLWPWRGALYHSLDAGLTWELITSTQPISRVIDIVYAPDAPGMIFVSTMGSGILRSPDNGQTWQRIGAQYSGLDYTNLVVEPLYPYRLLAPGGYISSDHGDTWQEFQVSGILGITRQYMFTPEEHPVLYGASIFGLVRSFDLGHTWSRMPGPLGYANIISMDAQAADDRVILYVGTTGGAVEVPTLLNAQTPSPMITAGVYRYTMRSYQLYLPIISRGR
ncbi:MAG: IPT/TIG domain-containing protein [Anaerolineales bacterium]|nr:IPT/TIG domain-containing protein [Anaerolineales bacterium]